MAKNTLTINGTDISTYGIYISSDTYLDAPKIDYGEFQIPARNGTAILDRKRLNNVIRKFDCYIPEVEDVDDGMNKLKKLLYQNKGYLTIISSYESGWYQYGYLAQEISVKPFNKKAAEFSLYFSCLPYKFFNTNTFDSTTHLSENQAMTGYMRNDSQYLVPILINLKNDYPYSPIGWVYMPFSPPEELSAGSYTVTCTSNTTQKYLVSLIASLDNITIIGEVGNYADTFSFDVPSGGGSHYYVSILFPILDYDQSISYSISNGITGTFNFKYNQITGSALTNNVAIGEKPIFMYKKPVTSYDYNGGADLFVINGNMYFVDYTSLCADVGFQNLRSLAVHYDSDIGSDCLYVKADFDSGELLLLNTFNADAEVNVDASSYFSKYGSGSFDSSVITAKFATYFGSFTKSEIDNIKCQPGWWKL